MLSANTDGFKMKLCVLQNQLTQSSSALESAEELLEFANTALHITDEEQFTKVLMCLRKRVAARVIGVS